jgi:hypothetical protein
MGFFAFSIVPNLRFLPLSKYRLSTPNSKFKTLWECEHQHSKPFRFLDFQIRYAKLAKLMQILKNAEV